MLKRIAKRELIHAQLALFIAISLQLFVWKIGQNLAFIPEYILVVEIFLAILIGFSASISTLKSRKIHHFAAIALIGLISVANISSLLFVLNSLIFGHSHIVGTDLLFSAIAIFLTNIIVFSLWYWEIDSPGLTRTKWSKSDQDFRFTQQESPEDYRDWRPEFIDYLYLSITNAINFAPADSKPLTRSAKLLMASQSLISVFTLALVISRSVSILG